MFEYLEVREIETDTLVERVNITYTMSYNEARHWERLENKYDMEKYVIEKITSDEEID